MATPRTSRARAPRLNTLAACLAFAFSTGVGADAATVSSVVPAPQANHASAEAHAAVLAIGARLRTRSAERRRALPATLTPRASNLPVTNCDDDGVGSLRQAAENAAFGDTIDLSQLTCSSITLTTGAIDIGVDNITVLGPGQANLTIDGNDSSRIFNGFGLVIANLTVANGRDMYGGCLYVNGNLTLVNATVTGCHAEGGAGNYAYGGGALVSGNATVQTSTISNNVASAPVAALGGGVYAGGTLAIVQTTISGNAATATGAATPEGSFARGGGVFASTGVQVTGSVISGNVVASTNGTAYGGGVDIMGDDSGNKYTTTNVIASTVSGNSAHSGTQWSYGGGINIGDASGSYTGSAYIAFSTLSGNTVTSDCASCTIKGGAANASGAIAILQSTARDNSVVSATTSAGIAYGGAVSTRGGFAVAGSGSMPGALFVQSSTVSGNHVSGGNTGAGHGGGLASIGTLFVAAASTIAFNEATTSGGGVFGGESLPSGIPLVPLQSTIIADNSAPVGADLATASAANVFPINGDHNLVMSTSANIRLPPDTLTDDPMLLPLACNGGPTATHALAAGSPAIDMGFVTSSGPGTSTSDQRGTPYVRSYGLAPDIGAYELQIVDRIFSDGFEIPPPALPLVAGATACPWSGILPPPPPP